MTSVPSCARNALLSLRTHCKFVPCTVYYFGTSFHPTFGNACANIGSRGDWKLPSFLFIRLWNWKCYKVGNVDAVGKERNMYEDWEAGMETNV